MLTSDISLTKDPEGAYQPLVAEFATNLKKLEHAFAHAWCTSRRKQSARSVVCVISCVWSAVAAREKARCEPIASHA